MAIQVALAGGDLKRAHSYFLFHDPTSSRGFELRKRAALRAADCLGLRQAADWNDIVHRDDGVLLATVGPCFAQGGPKRGRLTVTSQLVESVEPDQHESQTNHVVQTFARSLREER